MSRLAKNIIKIPASVTVTFASGMLSVKGPLGEVKKPVNPAVSIAVTAEGVKVEPVGTTKLARALTGTFASHVKNMMLGVTTKFVKKLELQGIGYRIEVQGKNVKFQVGFSHPVLKEIPAGIEVVIEKNNISVSGIDKEAVGQFAANIRAVKKPEPYKGKGIRYAGEFVRQKQGKKAAA